MIAALLAAAIAFFSGAASAADPAVADKPRLAVGDSWTYQSVLRAANRSKKVVETFEISGITGNRVHVVVLRKFDGEAEGEPVESDMVFSDDWNVMITGNRGARPSAIMRPSTAMLKFPVKPGESYPSDYDMETLPDGNLVRHRRATRVIGWEDITVPAGKFRALRIEAEGTVQVAKKPKPGPDHGDSVVGARGAALGAPGAGLRPQRAGAGTGVLQARALTGRSGAASVRCRTYAAIGER